MFHMTFRLHGETITLGYFSDDEADDFIDSLSDAEWKLVTARRLLPPFVCELHNRKSAREMLRTLAILTEAPR